MTDIASPLTLPCGLTLPNRLAKAAMTEQLAGPDHAPSERHRTLYRRWAQGGLGLQITGNVQIDRRHLEHPQNVVIDGEPDEARAAALRAWASEARTGGARLLMQISHAGRQTPKSVNPEPQAPSAVAVDLPGGQFGTPRAMTTGEIEETVARFAAAARAAEWAGFDGVQVHAAHGYLLSSFLNPRANRRTDEWGGGLENRARALLRTVEAVREEVSASFAVSVKLNSADFQRGGLTEADSAQVAGWLEARGVDLLEVSGGSYEQPAMMDMEGLEAKHEEAKQESTRRREAYFLRFAEHLRLSTTLPLMVTGGFRTRVGMNEALASGGADLIGLARPLCVEPDLPRRLLMGDAEGVPSYEHQLRLGPGPLGPTSKIGLVRALNGFGVMSFFYENIRRMGEGEEPKQSMSLLPTFVAGQMRAARAAKALAG